MRCLEKDPVNRPETAAESVRVIDGLTVTNLNETGEVPAAAGDRVRVTPPAATPEALAGQQATGRASKVLLAAGVIATLFAAARLLR